MIADAGQRARVALLHARWDPTSAPATEEWIELASTVPGFGALLAERIAQAPGDVLLRREEFDRADAARKSALCSEAGARAAHSPDNADLAYLALRCQGEGVLQKQRMHAAALRWPEHGWLANVLAYDALESRDWRQAGPTVERGAAHAAGARPRAGAGTGAPETLQRSERQPGRAAAGVAAPALSARIRCLSSGPAESAGRAYVQLARGDLASALAFAKGGAERQAHVLRLVAASDGAGAGQIAEALALPPERGQDASTAWLTLALAVKAGQENAPGAHWRRARASGLAPR
ncbi:hypothetical protein LP419_17525 [Massilia sp. H-1]|nr:hypothetical protein LP419_17525 [Massilia sp. H-1]